MYEMFFTDVTTLALTNPQAATAIATGDMVTVTAALVIVTAALVVAGCVIGFFQIRVVARGIARMTEAGEKRDARHQDAMEAAADRHAQAMNAEADRHKEAMAALAAEREACERRHEQTMKALDALIRNTAPGIAPAS